MVPRPCFPSSLFSLLLRVQLNHTVIIRDAEGVVANDMGHRPL